MDHQKFKMELAKTAIATGHEVTEMITALYWEEFGEWTDDQFIAACQRCRNDLDRFPTVHQLRERWSSCRNENTAHVIESKVPRIAAPEIDQDNLSGLARDLPDDEIKELMEARGYCPSAVVVVITKQIKPLLRQQLLKDLIRPGWDDCTLLAVRCSKCRDRGAVEVYSPRSFKGVTRDEVVESELRIKTVMVACECQEGKAHKKPVDYQKKMNQAQPMLEFDGNTMCRVTELGLAEQRAEFCNFLKNDYRPHNYNSEFSDW